MLSHVYTKIAGAVPSWISLQVLESEVRASKNAEECPYLVDGRCPHTGTGRMAGVRHAQRAMRMVPGDTLKISSDSQSSHPRIAVDLDSHALFGREGNGENLSRCRNQPTRSGSGPHMEQLSKG